MLQRFTISLFFTLLFLLPAPGFGQSGEPPPAEYFSRLPQISRVALSPDGKHLAYVWNDSGISVVVNHTPGESPAMIVQTDNEKFIFSWVKWLNNDYLLGGVRYPSLRYTVKNTETGMYKVNRRTKKYLPAVNEKRYRGRQHGLHIPQFRDRIISFLPDEPNHFLLGLDLDNPTYPDIYRVNIKNGRRKIAQHGSEPFRYWTADQQGRVRLRASFKDGERVAQFFDLEKQEWQPFWRYRPLEDPPRSILGFGADPNIVYVREVDEGLNAIFTVNLGDPSLPRKLVAADTRYDLNGGLIYSPKTRNPVGVYRTGDDGSPMYWNAEFKRLQKDVDQALPGKINWIYDISDDENKYIVHSSSDSESGSYFLGDRAKHELMRISRDYPELEGFELSGKKHLTYTTRDDLSIHAYLTEPWGDPPKPWPTIVHPHGGPMSRDYKDFDYWTEFFASRGYAVLQMNFRGSTGFGWNFTKSGLANMGREMQDDISDGTQFLIDQGIADPEKLCLVGASYGGYAALWGAIKRPDLYRCAVSFAGVTDWTAVLKRSRHFLNSSLVKKQLGERKQLDEVSVIEHAEKLTVPVLLVHGDKDRIVEPWHSQKLAKKLKRLGKEYRYIELENGSHSLSKQQNRTLLFKEMDQFLGKHLLGKH